MQITRTLRGSNTPGPTVAELRQMLDNVNDDVVVSLATYHDRGGAYESNSWSVVITEEDPK
jgi:hypothetical protein